MVQLLIFLLPDAQITLLQYPFTIKVYPANLLKGDKPPVFTLGDNRFPTLGCRALFHCLANRFQRHKRDQGSKQYSILAVYHSVTL